MSCRRRLAVHALLIILGCLAAVAVWLIAADLIAHPHDRWAAVLFVSGTVCGVAWDRRPR
jgi:hypothetical protein